MIACCEVLFVWAIAWHRRRKILAFVKANLYSRVLCTAIVMVAFYSIALGLSLSNAGMIARQRIFLFPFLFMLFAGGDSVVRACPNTRVRYAPGTVISPKRLPDSSS
jgi:hypothetical protein